MWSAASILMCALSVLGRDARTFPPIEFVESRPPDVSKNAEAFTRSPQNVIYIITSSAVFQTAQLGHGVCEDSSAIAKIASLIVHEEWHLRHDMRDENGAYDAQLWTLMRLGIGPGTALYDGVWRSRRAALEAQRRNAQRLNTQPAVQLARK